MREKARTEGHWDKSGLKIKKIKKNGGGAEN